MVTTTQNRRQASFQKILRAVFCLGALSLAACQAPEKTAPPRVAPTVGEKPVAALPLRSAPPIRPKITPILQKQSLSTRLTVTPPVTVSMSNPNPVPQRAADASTNLPAELPGYKITRVSATEWRAVPSSRAALNNSPTSLMEDAIITSSVHAKLKNIATAQPINWQYRSSAGVVTLKAGSLSREEAISALQMVLSLDGVSEVRLKSTLY